MAIDVDITKEIGNFRLDVAFQAEDEVFGLLGSSGCGKSMTLRCIAGIMQPDSGHIILNGRTLFDKDKGINLRPQQRHVGYLFQNYALFPNMTVLQNIETGIPSGESPELAREMMERMYLEEHQHQYAHQLSGGQQQRVALARLLVSCPEILLLDEPFSALDSYLQWQLELELMEILEEFAGTTLFVSHNRDEVYRLCDNITVLENGRISTSATKKGLFENPETLSAALLSGCKNITRAQRQSQHSVYCPDWAVTLRSDTPIKEDCAYVGVRAHYWKKVDTSQEGAIPCTVTQIIEELFSVVYLLDVDGAGEDALDSYRRLRWEIPKSTHLYNLKPGDPVILLPQPPDILFLST